MKLYKTRRRKLCGIRMRKPDNWHSHLRDLPMMETLVPISASIFSRTNDMGNKKPYGSEKPRWIRTALEAQIYKDTAEAIAQRALPGVDYKVHTTIMITDETTPEMIDDGILHEWKLMCRGASTHSQDGVTDVLALKLAPTWKRMEARRGILLIHAEMAEGDKMTREERFIEILEKFVLLYPKMRICIEHVSTRAMIEFVKRHPHIVCTVTPQHLTQVHEDQEDDSHNLCLPWAKTPDDRNALIEFVTSGSRQVIAGLDDAPHDKSMKENLPPGVEPMNGAWCLLAAISIYIKLFVSANALQYLEAFLSENGRLFRDIPFSTEEVYYEKKPYTVPEKIPWKHGILVPWLRGETLEWGPGELPV